MKWRYWLLLIFLAACQSKPPATPPPVLQVVTTSSHITLTENRVVMTFWEGAVRFDAVQSVQVKVLNLEDSKASTQQAVVWEGSATPFRDYAVPYWTVYPIFPTAGFWYIEAVVHTTSGAKSQASFLVKVEDDDPSTAVGTSAPPSLNLTTTNSQDLFRITSDVSPNPVFYTQTVAEAVTSGQPSVILFASPGLCSNLICTPVMDKTFEPLWARYGEQMNFVHVEVFDLQTAEYVATMAEWGLNYEPWMFLVDGDGLVAARFDGPVAISEMMPALESLLED